MNISSNMVKVSTDMVNMYVNMLNLSLDIVNISFTRYDKILPRDRNTHRVHDAIDY
jgi:hypothetical protein